MTQTSSTPEWPEGKPRPSPDYIPSVFGPDGHLAKAARAIGITYEERLGQVALARHVDAAIRNQEHAIAEGPCGTGKGIAYAVPAIYHAHHNRLRVVIVTANLALQDQLILKDLPMLQKALPWKFTFAAIKGRSNYFCAQRTLEEDEKGTFDGATDALREAVRWGLKLQDKKDLRSATAPPTVVEHPLRDFQKFAEGGRRGEFTLVHDGDRRNLPLAVSNKEWSQISTTSDDCLAESCPLLAQDLCHYARARAECQEADLIVTNMHVLGAHLSIRQMTGMDLVLPEHHVVIVDEAHELTEAIREFFGFSISERTFDRFGKRIDKTDFVEKSGRSKTDHGYPLMERLRKESHDFFRDVADFAQGKRTRLEHTFLEAKVDAKPLLHTLLDISQLAERFEEESEHDVDGENDETLTYKKIKTRADELYGHVSEFLGQEIPNNVYWVDFAAYDRRGMYPKLEGRPLEVGGILNKELFKKTNTVVMMSATLTTTPGNFKFMRNELGVPREAAELAVPSPFDTENQTLIVVPARGTVSSNPNAPEQIDKAVSIIQDVMTASDGRCLGLFTSYRMLEEVQKRVKSTHPIYFQEREGISRNELVALFKKDLHSSLFGTSSFWTGIDVPGQALTTVIIDKLPFDHQDEPLVEAMKEAFDTPDEESNRFWEWYTMRALLKLRQGVGRLVRSRTDYGVVVILDRRLAMKSYGKKMVKALGPIRKSNHIKDITEHLATAPGRIEANREAFEAKQRQMRMVPVRPPPPPPKDSTARKIPKGVF